MARQPSSSSHLADERLFPRVARERFWRDVVRFHLEDLNAAGDRLRVTGLSRDQKAQVRTEALDRIAAIVTAASWNRQPFVAAMEGVVAEGRVSGDDAFGPAVIFIALEINGTPSARTFLETLNAKTRRLADGVVRRIATNRPGRQPRGRPK